MDNIAMLFVCLGVGMALRWFARVPDNAHVTINAFIINVALPALILQQIHGVRIDPTMVFAVVMPWLIFGASVALFWLVGRQLKLPQATIGALAVIGGLGNTSFLGLPMIEGVCFILHLIRIVAYQLGLDGPRLADRGAPSRRFVQRGLPIGHASRRGRIS